MNQRHGLMTVAVCCLLLPLAGCAGTGPKSIKTGRGNYNVAIQQTNDEQLLLNLVRLKYCDTPLFLEVTSVATSFTFEVSASANASIPEGALGNYGLGAAVASTDEPTVTYTPLQGEQFVTQLMSPIDLNVVQLLCNSGWSLSRILRVCIQRMNDVENASNASGPTPSRPPKYTSFFEATDILRDLQVDGELQAGQAAEVDHGVEFLIDPEAARRTEGRRLWEILGLRGEQPGFVLTTGQRDDSANHVAVRTRSLTGAMFYLAQGVEVPVADETQGRVMVTRDRKGDPFDWKLMTGDILRIRSATARPPYAGIAVNYRGAWFYIDDRDLDSKSTFAMLMQLYALQAGEIKGTGPVLTLPIGR